MNTVRLKLKSGDEEISIERNVGQQMFDEYEDEFIVLSVEQAHIPFSRKATQKLVNWLEAVLKASEDEETQVTEDEEEEPELAEDEKEDEEYEADEDEVEAPETDEEKEVKE